MHMQNLCEDKFRPLKFRPLKFRSDWRTCCHCFHILLSVNICLLIWYGIWESIFTEHSYVFTPSDIYYSAICFLNTLLSAKYRYMLVVLAKKSIACVCCVSQLGQGTVCCGWWMWGSTIWRSHLLNSPMTLSMSARLQRLPCAPAEPNSLFSVSVCVCVRERESMLH